MAELRRQTGTMHAVKCSSLERQTLALRAVWELLMNSVYNYMKKSRGLAPISTRVTPSGLSESEHQWVSRAVDSGGWKRNQAQSDTEKPHSTLQTVCAEDARRLASIPGMFPKSPSLTEVGPHPLYLDTTSNSCLYIRNTWSLRSMTNPPFLVLSK